MVLTTTPPCSLQKLLIYVKKKDKKEGTTVYHFLNTYGSISPEMFKFERFFMFTCGIMRITPGEDDQESSQLLRRRYLVGICILRFHSIQINFQRPAPSTGLSLDGCFFNSVSPEIDRQPLLVFVFLLLAAYPLPLFICIQKTWIRNTDRNLKNFQKLPLKSLYAHLFWRRFDTNTGEWKQHHQSCLTR